jgi:hypothetical protein
MDTSRRGLADGLRDDLRDKFAGESWRAGDRTALSSAFFS